MKLFRVGRSKVTTRVSELILALQALPQNAFVYTEGCDCTGNVVCVEVDADGDVLICRDDYVVVFPNGEPVVAEKYASRVVDAQNE